MASSRSFGIAFGNPDTTPADEFRFAICGEVREAVSANEFGVTEPRYPRRALRRGAAYGLAGSHRRIGSSDLSRLAARQWRGLRDHPLFFDYLSVFPGTPQDQWQTDIYVPLQSL